MADYRLTQTGDQVQEILNNATMRSELAAEIERATGAEQTLQQNINAEASAREQADTTLQGNIATEEVRARAAEQQNATDIDAIEAKIPAAASTQNKLVDEQKMNSSIATETATYRGSYNIVTDLHLTISATESDIANALAATIATADNNDYCYIQIPVANDKPTEIARIDRYKFNGTTWALEYTLNNSGFTAAQWDAINSGITSGLVAKLNALPNNAELIALLAAKADDSDIDAINAKIPAAASAQNQLADKAFVNNAISTNSATFRGTFNEVTDLSLSVSATHTQIATALAGAIATVDNNDYAFVQIPVADATPTVIASVERYKFNGTSWGFEYELNNSGFTSAQWDALNSGITSGLVAKLSALPTNTELTNLLAGKQATIVDLDAIRSGATAGATAYQKPVGGIPDTDLSAALQQALASFITKAVTDLTNYYLKSDTYSKNEVDQLIAAINQFELVSVATLPTASAATMGKLYFVPSADPQTSNVKDEYITLSVTEQGTTTYYWELIGQTTIDLSNYYTKTQTDAAITAALASYMTSAQAQTLVVTSIQTALGSYYNKTEIDTLIGAITAKIPTEASSSNQLADKAYVAAQVQEYAGSFRGTFNSVAELEATTGNNHNDYAWVQVTDSDGDNDYDRYKYNGTAWVFEYRLTNNHFTTAELASIQSGMTTEKRQKLDALPTNAELTTKLNALTRRTRLSDFDLAVLKQAVADQNLEKYGLKVGDYKTINGHDYVIAGLNPMKGPSTPYRVNVNHVGLIVIPHTTQAWNASGNTYTGADSRGAGYANSDLHYYLVNTLLPLVKTDLGAANLLAHSKLLSNEVNQNGINRYGEATGCSSGWGWVADQYISALSEVQVYGSIVWSSSGFDTGEACRQLDVFRHFNHTEIFGSEYPWLRDVVSASSAAYASYRGNASHTTASSAFYVAALILFN